MYELRAVLQQHLSEGELQMYVESCLAHHEEIVGIKEGAMKGDVFHLISGVLRSPAKRCFLWLGGFSPSEVIKSGEDVFAAMKASLLLEALTSASSGILRSRLVKLHRLLYGFIICNQIQLLIRIFGYFMPIIFLFELLLVSL